MDNIVKVYISGPALSLLLYENLRCLNDQEGFLLGKKYARKLTKITDHDETVETIEWEIHINSVIPCTKMASFYKGNGSIMQESIHYLLNELYDEVVGWYTFKREPDLRLSLRKKIIHKNLSAIFSTDAMEHFVWCFTTINNNQEKHTNRQSFLRYIETPGQQITGFQELPLHIINLSDSKNEYKSAGIPSACLNGLIAELKKKTPTADRHSLVTKLEDTLQGQITRTVKDVSESEQELFELEKEMYQLAHPREIEERDNILDNEDCSFEGNDSNEDMGAVEESPKSNLVTKRRRQHGLSPILHQSSPLNGVAFDKDRGERPSPSISPVVSGVTTTRSYSQAAKVKQ